MKVNRLRLEELKREKGWNQNQMAKILGIHKTSLNAMMTGRRNVGTKTLSRFIKVFPNEEITQIFIMDE